MKVAVIGASGQLGTDLVRVFGSDCLPLTHAEIEVTDPASVKSVLSQHRPEVVINTAAFHQVDACEENPNRAWEVNALGARNVAEACAALGAVCVYISTDFVFDGAKGAPYTEDDCPLPLNTYGITKLAGECYTRLCPKHYVFRVASLFGAAGASGKGGNFVETVIKKARAGEPLRVVSDIFMSPTYTRDAASCLREIIFRGYPFGVYHVTNEGVCSWYDFAAAVFRFLKVNADLTPTNADALGQRARRPRFSALASVKRKEVRLPSWEEALKAYLKEKGYLAAS